MTPIDLPDRFEILAELVRTPAVVLLRARDRTLHREVLLKLPGVGLEGAFRDRSTADVLMREARALARLSHPGVARVLDVLETEQGPVQVLEPVVGEPLANRLAREGVLAPAAVTKLGLALARTLEAVHTGGIVHRGLSTTCVVLRSDDSPFLTGFHFSKSVDTLGSLSATGSLSDSLGVQPDHEKTAEFAAVARPAFPAPEQLAGRAADQRSDLFSLGWILHLSLTGEHPFDAGVPAGPPNDARAAAPDTPVELARILARCLDPDPIQRYPSARELGDALQKVHDAPAAEPTQRPIAAPRRALVGAGAALLVVAAGALALKFGGNDAEAGDGLRGIGGTRTGRAVAELSDEYENSYALLIGIGEVYRERNFPPLRNAEGDVHALAAELEKSGDGWQVDKLIGAAATGDEVIEALGRLASKTSPNDRVLIYYGGHGLAHENSLNTGWMIPADGVRGRRSSYVRFDEFSNFFQEARAKHVLLAMDCCYGGRLTTLRSAKAEAFKRRFLQEEAHVILSSGRGDEEVSDGDPGAHSPFAEAFLEALRNGETITSHMLYSDILRTFNERDVQHTPRLGHPKGSAARGQFVFFL